VTTWPPSRLLNLAKWVHGEIQPEDARRRLDAMGRLTLLCERQ
jgi:hypothetical protein